MSRPLRTLLAVLGLVLAIASCGRPKAPSSLAPAEVLRCDPAEDTRAAYREASRLLLEEARSEGRFAGELVVAYDEPGDASGLPGAALRRDLAASVRRDHGTAVVRSLGRGRELVAVRDAGAAERLLDDPRVRYAHPAIRLVPHAEPNDLDYGMQWNLSSFGLAEAWDLEMGDEAVTVAIVDAGMDVAHPEFAGRLVPGWDFYDGDDDVSSLSSHGTHVSGIAAATAGNGIGIAGVAGGGVRILPIKVFADDPRISDERSLEAVADAIRWAAALPLEGEDAPPRRERPVQVVNLSLGTERSYVNVPMLDEAIRDARRQGVVVVASVGNHWSETGVTSPANSPCALAVASVDESLERSSFSNFDGDTRVVDIAGPGGFSAQDRGIYSTMNDEGYGSMHGTSMAAPFVSGAAALLASAHPDWDDVQILERLLTTAHLPDASLANELGFGIACADAALGATTRCGR